MAREWLSSRRWPQLRGASDERFVRAGAASLLVSNTASARMGALVGCVSRALGDGAAIADVLVVCADPSAAARMRRELASRASGPVEVLTARELACRVLGDARASHALGLTAAPRLLSAYEADFVVEDVKTLGTRPKRLRELLKFLYRGWTELSDEDPGWLFTVEEVSTIEFLSDELAYLGAVMEPQLSNLATKALRLDAGLLADVARPSVFVLDYQNLSRASQLLCQLVADTSLVVAADADACAETHESYPYPRGTEEFARLNPQASVERLGDASGACERSERVWDTPADEVRGVADEIAGLVAAGTDPSDVGVMALHPWWARRVAEELGGRGVPTNAWYGPLTLRGDIRDLDRCLVPRAVTLLRLLADPADAIAWRCWFGFGDYLARSNQFAEMRAGLAGGALGGVRADLEAFGHDFGDADRILASARGLRGLELLACLLRALGGDASRVPPALARLGRLGDDADAKSMVAELDRQQFFCGIPEKPGVVVSSCASMAGLDFGRAYAVGFVNGLFPSSAYFDLTQVTIDRQQKMHVRDECTARLMARLGREEMCVSRFERAGHAFAERCGLKQVRIVAADDAGAMVSEVEPSIYTDVLLGRA